MMVLRYLTALVVLSVLFFVLAVPVLAQAPGQVQLPGLSIPKYVDPLPALSDRPVDGTRPVTMTAVEFQQKVLPDAFYTSLPVPFNTGTFVWGYRANDGEPHYPAYPISAVRGTPTQVTYVNDLQQADGSPPFLQQYLYVDQTLHWADPFHQHETMPMTRYVGPVPTVTHLHGGETPSVYDGGPFDWFTANGLTGPSYTTNVYTYNNTQEPATLWFHDHVLGMTRLNNFAGLAGMYILRDPETERMDLPAGPYEQALVIQDRMFDMNGQLLFPNTGNNPSVHPFWVPEFFGDVIVVNGKTWPYFNVEPRRYRFRILNPSNARFYRLYFQGEGPDVWQIGTDGGYLDRPVRLDSLLIAPSERADIIVDFSRSAGDTIILRNNAYAPFPGGDPVDPNTTGQIMQFRVVLPLASRDRSFRPTPGTRLRTPMVRLANPENGSLAGGVEPDRMRLLTLNEVESDIDEPLEVLLNNTRWDGAESPNAGGVTEQPRVGSTEIWQIANMTEDAHPIHIHLGQFQLLNRQDFNVDAYDTLYKASFPGGTSPTDHRTYPPASFIPAFGPPLPYASTRQLGGNPDIRPYLLGRPRPPEPNEAGWKDTFVMYPGQVTRVVLRWAPQETPVRGRGAASPGVNLYGFDPTKGPGYVWHCHILDHEDNEMMRPYSVVGPIIRGIGASLAGGTGSRGGSQGLTDIGTSAIPTEYTLSQNYPDPFNPSTTIDYDLPKQSHVVLKIYDVLGREITTLVDNDVQAGYHSVRWDAGNVASGLYLYRITAGDFLMTKKMTVVR